MTGDDRFDKTADAARLEMLRQNYAATDGLRKLDQQFAYVPLAGMAAVLFAAAANRSVFIAANLRETIFPLWAGFVVLVLIGFARNHYRYLDYLRRRTHLLRRLGVSDEVFEADPATHLGRVVYFALFLFGLTVEMKVLYGLL